ncbi:MAG TPA: PilZ domain-containing protein [Armatimonadota bacterium]|nr:PilZ domain-containing protein [Armatimonadota bacterium]
MTDRRPRQLVLAALAGCAGWVVPCLAQVQGKAQAFGARPEDFYWGGPGPGRNWLGFLIILLAVTIAVGLYLLYLRFKRRADDQEQRVLGNKLDRIYGWVHFPNLLVPGVRIALEVEQHGAQRVYHSVVESAEGGTAEVASPMEDGVTVPLRVGQRIGVVVRKSPFAYRFETNVLERASGRIPTITITTPPRVLRYQRREYLRVSVRFPAQVQLRMSGARGGPRVRMLEGRVVSLSGSGIGLEIGMAVRKLRFLSVTFALPDGQAGAIAAECQAVAQTMRPSRGGGYVFGAQFTQISRRDRERIVRYVRTVERLNRKRARDQEADKRDEMARAHGR